MFEKEPDKTIAQAGTGGRFTPGPRNASEVIPALISELEQDRSLLDVIFGSITEGVIVIDSGGRLASVNLPAADILGIPQDCQSAGLLFSEILADKEEEYGLWERLRKEKTIKGTQITLKKRDGSFVYTLSNFFGAQDHTGLLTRCYLLFVELAEVKVEEEQRLKKLASFPELNPTPIVEIDLSGQVQYLNSIARKLFPDLESRGIEHPYLAGSNALTKTQDHDEINLVRREININGECFGQSIQYVPEKRTIRIYGANITQRKKAEEELRSSEEKFRNLFENAPVGVSISTFDGRGVERNLAAQKMHGYDSKEEFMRLTGPELYYDLKERERFMALAQKGPVRDFELRRKRKDGSVFWVSLTAIPYLNQQGEKQLIVITQDITERKRIEEQLITTSRLATIGELASGVAHEINNPLTSVIGFSELLLERPLPDDIRADLSIIRNEAERAARVVKNLLTFARKHPNERQAVNVNDVIGKVLELRAYDQKVNNILVTTLFASAMPNLMADGFQLQQVFFNLIINAEYFMIESHKKGNLTIATEVTGGLVRASIADDGPGISEENLKHLFNPFFTTKPVGKGTGLGLSICHGIISAHGGRIFVESALGKGTKFTVELPLGS